MLEQIVTAASSAFVKALLQATGKSAGDSVLSSLEFSRQSRQRLNCHIESVLGSVSRFVTYRASSQHIDEAFVEPRIIDGALSTFYFRPDIAKLVRDAVLQGNLSPSELILSSSFKRNLEASQSVQLSYLSVSELQKVRGLLILGDAGSGKSTLLSRLCYLLLRSESGRLPLFLDSRKLEAHDLFHYLDELLSSLGLENLPPAKLGESLAFFVDGLDELPRAKFFAICQEIERLRKQFPNALLAVSCRSAAYRGELSFLQEVTIAPFTIEEAEDFVRRWFQPVREGPTAEDLLASLQKEERVRELATQPLLLALICNAFRRYLRISRRQTALFKQCVDALLWEWDTRRGITRSSDFEDLDLEKRVWLHSRLAFEIHNRRTRYMAHRDLVELLASWLPSFGIESQKARTVLTELCMNFGLVIKLSEDTYGFGHLALQEFLAGKWLSQEQRWLSHFDQEMLCDSWWRNTLALAIGSLSDATDALKRIAHWEGMDEFQRYSLAAHCLRHDPIVDGETRASITRKILGWYHNGTREEREEALLMLVGIDDVYTAGQIRESLQARLPSREDAEIVMRRSLERRHGRGDAKG